MSKELSASQIEAIKIAAGYKDPVTISREVFDALIEGYAPYHGHCSAQLNDLRRDNENLRSELRNAGKKR